MKTLVVIPAFAVTAFVIGEAMKIFRSIQMKYALLMEILGAMSLEIKRLTESNRQQREMIEELTIQQSNELETAQSDSNEHLSQLNNTNQSLQEQMKESGEKLQPSQLKIQALTIDLDTASTEKSNVNEEMNQLTVSRDEAIVKADSLKLELQLLKALYVLKQAGRVWNLQLNQLLIETGFVPTTADPCVYVYRREGTLIVLAIHVDDGLIAYNNKKELQVILDKLHKKYRLKDLGQPSKFLGCHIKQEPDGTIKLHQKLYIEEIAQRFGMINSNPTQTPYLSGLNYDKNELKSTTLEESIRMKSYPVRALQGCLRFAAEWTHPEILEPLGKLCKHMESPSYRLWEAGNEILRYLNSVKEEGLSYKRDGNILPEGYIDADWAGCNDNDNDARKSTSSLVILLANAPITTKCKPQNCVSLSSTEAEYVAHTSGSRNHLVTSSAY